MGTAAPDVTLPGEWDAHLTFTSGPRKGAEETVRLRFLPDGAIVHADESPVPSGQLPRGVGEWSADPEGNRFSYFFNVVLNDPAGRPTTVTYVHAQGSPGPDGQTFTATGGSEVYRSGEEPLAIHHVEVQATRAAGSMRSTQERRSAVWERWWNGIEGTPGEIVWDADEADLVADLEVFGAAFDRSLPLIDLGCGDGRQTRFLARHFDRVVGVDVSPAAVDRARGADNPPHVSYRVLDVSSPAEAERLHTELGDANVYVRGVLQALHPAARPDAVTSISTLLGQRGTLFAKELPPEASTYFRQMAERHGMPPQLERVMRLIPPGQISEEELVRLFPADGFEVLATGAGRIETINVAPDGEPIRVPAVYLLTRRHRPGAAEDDGAGVGTSVLFENDRVRVWEMTLEPGETCPPHRHRHDYLMLYPEPAVGRSTSRSRVEHLDAGFVAFAAVGRQGLPPHQITNLGHERARHYIVELLGPSATATAQPPAHNGRIHVELSHRSETGGDA